MFILKKQHCVDCAFFVKEPRGIAPGISEITESERKLARAGDYSWHKDHWVILCHHAVWDQGHNFDISKKHDTVTRVNRKGSCFFLKHHPGMMLPAARLLQERDAKEARNRRLTVYGLLIAGIGLIANVYLKIAETQSWWPY